MYGNNYLMIVCMLVVLIIMFKNKIDKWARPSGNGGTLLLYFPLVQSCPAITLSPGGIF